MKYIDISQKGKGAKEKKLSLRDFRFEKTSYARATLEEFNLEPFLNDCEDQGSSSSCVAQEIAGYAEGLNAIETGLKQRFSKKYLYSLIHFKSGGAYTVDAISRWQNEGMMYEKDIPSYENGNPPSESFMTEIINPTQEQKDEAMKYICGKYTTWDNRNWETYKQAIRAGKGCLAICYGVNSCWYGPYIETPNLSKENCAWSHQILFVNSKPIIKNGIEYLKFRNSWGKDWGDNGYGYLPKTYVEKGLVVCPLTVVDLPNDSWIKVVSIWENLKTKILEFIKNFKK